MQLFFGGRRSSNDFGNQICVQGQYRPPTIEFTKVHWDVFCILNKKVPEINLDIYIRFLSFSLYDILSHMTPYCLSYGHQEQHRPPNSYLFYLKNHDPFPNKTFFEWKLIGIEGIYYETNYYLCLNIRLLTENII